MSRLYADMLVDTCAYLDASFGEGFRMTPGELEHMQLEAVRKLFAALRPRVAALDKLASEQKMDKICSFEDAARLLLPHTAFKSYPLAWIERGDFERLTRWLAGLTALDLRAPDCKGIRTVDDWIDHLDRTTDLRIVHTFGTSGKLSLIPRTRMEWERGAMYIARCLRDWCAGAGRDLLRDHLPIVQPGYRHGASAGVRAIQTVASMFAGGLENVLFLYPEERFSADVASLAGRVRRAELHSGGGSLISPELASRREEFERRERERPRRTREFFEAAVERFGGQDIYLFGVWPVLSDWAEEGLRRGMRGAFGRNSILHTGGGTKGRSLPERWRERIFDFLGFETHYEFYAMTEVISACPRCVAGNYHVPPVLVPFVLDPRSGDVFPRHGRCTGRFGVIDLLATTYWCGLVTGDEVTIAGWDSACVCGRTGPYVEPTIRRYSEIEGGDDKINCAGAPEAHDRAIRFLVDEVYSGSIRTGVVQ